MIFPGVIIPDLVTFKIFHIYVVDIFTVQILVLSEEEEIFVDFLLVRSSEEISFDDGKVFILGVVDDFVDKKFLEISVNFETRSTEEHAGEAVPPPRFFIFFSCVEYVEKEHGQEESSDI